jgi:hypothetical protein
VADLNQTPGEEPAGEPEQENPSIKFEHRDVPFRPVLIIAIVGAGIGAAIFALVYAFFRADTDRLAYRRESEFPLAEHPSNALPAKPVLEQVERLEGKPGEDVYQRLLAQEAQLETYGETNDKGFVHIPIRQAMGSLADHLPFRKEQAASSKDNGLVDSGASNSGRMFRKGAP